MSKALAKSRNHPKGEECCDMSFEGLSPELMLCVRIRRERLWCSRPASKRSRQVFRRLLDQTAWDPNLGSRRVLRPILPRTEVSERQPPFLQDARAQIDRPSRDLRMHRAKENTCDNHFARSFLPTEPGPPPNPTQTKQPTPASTGCEGFGSKQCNFRPRRGFD
jgi:hypothetical protein